MTYGLTINIMQTNQDLFSLLLVAFNVTAPIFVLITLGGWLNYKKLMNDNFINISSKIIFNIGLPIMLFKSTATRDFSQLFNLNHILLILATTFIMFFASKYFAGKTINQKKDKGVFVQGAFRGNLMIIGLALAANAYGEEGIAIATLPMAVIIILYNLLSIYTLNSSLYEEKFSLQKNLKDIITNPLIIGILLGLFANLIQLPLPNLVIKTSDYLSQMTLPLALLTIGGTLNLLQLRDNIRPALIASVWKVAISPIILIILILFWPVEPKAAGVLFLLAACPTATASFIMVKAMGGNSDLAAKIIIISTLLSLFTITIGFATLVSFGIAHP